MPKRKTVSVDYVRERANTFLAYPDTTPEGRQAVAGLLEAVLFETGNYAGFSYLRSELTESDTLRDDHDDTRRRYA